MNSFNDTLSVQRGELIEAPAALSVRFLSYISSHPGSFVLAIISRLCFPFALIGLGQKLQKDHTPDLSFLPHKLEFATKNSFFLIK